VEDNKYINHPYHDESIDIRETLKTLWSKKLQISAITSIVALISVLYSLSIPNIYTSSALLSPSSDSQSLSSSLGGISGLAGFAGINLPTSSGNPTIEAAERIMSYDFFVNNFLPNINLEDLVAVKSWNPITNKIDYDKNVYDEATKKWIRKVRYPKKSTPSNQEAFKRYKFILSVKDNKKTGFYSLSVNHHSPFIAKEWTEIIIKKINETMRELDKQQATKSIEFLNETYKKNSVANMKESISKLLLDQMQKLMLTSASEGYVFKIIDSPIAPERKTSPSRAFICIFGTIFGLIVSSLMVLILQYFKK